MTTHTHFTFNKDDIKALLRVADIIDEIEKSHFCGYWTPRDLEFLTVMAKKDSNESFDLNILNATRMLDAKNFSMEIPREEQNA